MDRNPDHQPILDNKALTLPSQEAKALVRSQPTRVLANALSAWKREERSSCLALVPADRVPAVLALDKGVYDTDRYADEELKATVEPISDGEYAALKLQGFSSHLVPISSGLFGNVTQWGLASWTIQFRETEALERLDAILGSDNEPQWKHEVLTNMGAEYWALALRWVKERTELDARIDAIEAIDRKFSTRVRDLLEEDEKVLLTRVMEDREATIARVEEEEPIMEVDLETMQQVEGRFTKTAQRGKQAKDMLAALRAKAKKE